MVDKLPVVFRKSPPFTVSYDWIDTTSGFGYRRYYPTGTYATAGNGFFLSTKIVDSASNNYGDSIQNNTTNFNFDVDVNIPVTISEGDALVNFTTYVEAGEGSVVYTVTVYHVNSAAAETSLGTANVTVALLNVRNCLKIPLTKKEFGKGDKLRVSVDCVAAATADYRLYYDPTSLASLTDPDGRTIGTDMTIDIPFKIDV